MPGVDLPEGAVLCLENPGFSGCAPLLPSAVASGRPGMLLQATHTYVATFAALPEGNYVLTIPAIGSFPGYRTTITLDRTMPSVIAIELPNAGIIAEEPGPPGARDDPNVPAPPIAGPNPDRSLPSTDPGAGLAVRGDGTSGATASEPERSSVPQAQSSQVTMLPSTGTGRIDAPGVVPLGTLLALSLLILFWAVRWTVHRLRR